MKMIQYVVSYSSGEGVEVDVAARDINSGITKAVEAAKSYATNREVIGVAFAQVLDFKVKKSARGALPNPVVRPTHGRVRVEYNREQLRSFPIMERV